MNNDFSKISPKAVALGSSVLLLFFLFSVNSRVNAYTETKTGEISTSKISDFIPSGVKTEATVKDINKYFSVDDAQLASINQCNAKKSEAQAAYDAEKCQEIVGSQQGYFFSEWFFPQSPELTSCLTKLELINANCAAGTFSAATFGLQNGPSPYLSVSKITGFFGSYNQGKIYGWMEGPNKLCAWKEVPWWYITNCYNFTAEEGYKISCSQSNTYNYSFDYQTKKLGEFSWGGLNSGDVNKCQDIKLVFSSIADFSANLQKNKETGGRIDFFNYRSQAQGHVPPTDIMSCASQTECLAQAKEYEVTPGTGNFAKGALQVPAGFKETAEKSLLSSDNAKLVCSDGICKTTKVGSYSVKATAPQSTYYGQCREGSNIVNTDGQNIGAIESSINLNVVNRAPVVLVSLSGNSANVNEEVTATCDVSDPDACVDKITKVKWYCYNAQKEKVNCYFGKDGIWKEGEASEEIPEDKQSFEYRSIVKFKAGVKGIYALNCEATDNDFTSKAVGKGIVPIKIGDCIKDGVCNESCNPKDPDCGVVSEKLKFCSILFDNGSTNKTICGKSVNSTLSVYKASTIEDKDVAKYQWDCGNGEGVKEGISSTQNCSYSKEGNFIPALKIYYKDGSEPTDCSSENNSVTVTSSAKCSVLARPSGSKEEYKKEVKVGVNQPIETKVEKECTKEEDKTSWLTDGMKVGTPSDTKAVIKYQSGGLGYIKAKIGNTECEGVNVTVDEKMKWGN